MKLFDDQREVVESVRGAMSRTKSVLLVSPTGSGKTAMAIYMINSAASRGKRMLFSVPRRDLMEQTSETFSALNIAHSFVAAGKPYNPYAQVFIGMVDSMARRVDALPDIDFLIVDETHFGDAALDKIIAHYKAAGKYILGLSATPWKLSGKGLGCWYDDMVVGKSTRWLMDNGRLSDFRYFYGRTKLDLSSVKIAAGDYAKGELASYMESQQVIIGDCVEDYKKRCMGNLHIVRCASIKHSQMTAAAFQQQGINFVHVDGETPADQRKQIFRAFARKEIFGLCFAELLNFGFDLAQAAQMDVCIESGSDTKPSKSLAGQMQFWGRMLRKKPTAAIINDHVNNYLEHGFPDTEREWTLADRQQTKRSSGDRTEPVRQCMQCFFAHRPAPACPNCGNVYEIKSRELETVDGELHEMTKEQMQQALEEQKKQRRIEQGKARTLPDLIALGLKRGMTEQKARGWAFHVMKARREYGQA